MDIVALFDGLQADVTATTRRQCSRIVWAMLVMTGRVTMLGLALGSRCPFVPRARILLRLRRGDHGPSSPWYVAPHAGGPPRDGQRPWRTPCPPSPSHSTAAGHCSPYRPGAIAHTAPRWGSHGPPPASSAH